MYMYTQAVWHSLYLALNVPIKHKNAQKNKYPIFKNSNVTS